MRESEDQNELNPTDESIPRDRAAQIHRWTMRILHGTLTIGFVLAIQRQQWLTAVSIAAIFAVIILGSLAFRKMEVYIPPEFELLAVLFVYASLFLGEVLGYYQRFWWWDIALHASSSLLLGILGFLLVYVLNENDQIDLHMRPRFVALFAFLFAVSIGTLWEIFEFGMDQLFGMNMQKPMFDDPSGLTDTMWDLIVDTVGALVISVFGWWYLERPQRSFIEEWIARFIDGNPTMFGRK